MRHGTVLIGAMMLGVASGLSCAKAPPEPQRAAVLENVENVENLANVPSRTTAGPDPLATPVSQAPQLIAYYHAIRLTPEQEQMKHEALSSIPAPCCSNFSIATCCCPCNLAKSVWGLAHHLIAERRYDVPAVRQAVVDWLASSNPNGYSGDACFTGGCQRAFSQNGCGGMDEQHVVS
jgi:hypothetical protein